MGNLKKLEIKKNIQKNEDKNLSFRVFDLSEEYLKEYRNPHKKDHFLIIVIESGTLNLHIESKVHPLKSGKISVIFPEQVHFISDLSHNVKGKLILFEEILFCSDILKNELSTYNVHLSTQLNCTILSPDDFKQSLHLIQNIQEIYQKPSLIKKEQARFQIKIFLLGLIESVHGLHPILHKETADKPLYVQFKKLLNEQYKQYRTVQYYAGKLAITPKKLNTVTKKHCGETAIQAIHNRILMEIKRQLMFSDLSHKEIAFDLGFNSPSALNKFVKAKLKETPTELQHELAQMYNA
ncbi:MULTISPECIES: AraC family transcriptional regulator [Chryseobacterium]|uniref:AraC family transcriptional activator of pobA n=1 Tax=Chryseobacterium camelliae TaxID=1265445 RepID=A0ABU0THP3_9FLAO|nr:MULTISPECIES: helix-turn-helix transcriptional regulator [Chryseobacterium]MDT3409557.1 AraC family transcriptional activator of pobA [Pseudacidovorax intermedius]MDQ1096581.1 AraC family transcriptional activator of pobA [Chryseobacterium camelliae]MDQ1100522.1 AraC family transcriptional activator of pobA [Chryseobacterium sp. SORGH_AS_1048]MDR6087862.1 AraC family transcriptional activator of pobA [Chryseobacterium sp. SORGH_AS_0909]MDR6132238.1 AraC family transcriptional activator of p